MKGLTKKQEKEFEELKIGKELLNGYTAYRNKDEKAIKNFISKVKKETAQEIIKLIDTIESENLNSTFDEWREYKGIRNRIVDKYLK